MQALGKRLGQPIRQRLDHDRVVIVVVGFIVGGQLVDPQARGDGEGADVVAAAAVERGDKIGQGPETRLAFAPPLLSQCVKPRDLGGARFVGK